MRHLFRTVRNLCTAGRGSVTLPDSHIRIILRETQDTSGYLLLLCVKSILFTIGAESVHRGIYLCLSYCFPVSNFYPFCTQFHLTASQEEVAEFGKRNTAVRLARWPVAESKCNIKRFAGPAHFSGPTKRFSIFNKTFLLHLCKHTKTTVCVNRY